MTVNGCPAIVSMPVRAAPLFALTLNVIVPAPVPDIPASIVIQGSLAEAIHAQVLPALTVTLPVPPMASTVWPFEDRVKTHGGGGAACMMVNGCPAIVSVPVRAPPVFGMTVKVTVPLPDPLAPPVIVTHGSLAEAVHARVVP